MKNNDECVEIADNESFGANPAADNSNNSGGQTKMETKPLELKENTSGETTPLTKHIYGLIDTQEYGQAI